MLDPVSPQAEAISNLFNITLILGAFVFALVTGLVVYIAVRYRGGTQRVAGDREPKQVHGNTRLEVAWIAGPAIIVIGLFVLTVYGGGQADPLSVPALRAADVAAGLQQAPEADIVVIGHQWWWEVRYPAAAVTTANEIHLPVGRGLRARLEAADVIHDLWIPNVSRKIDMTPGHITYLLLQADRPGTFFGACAEYCGVEHSWMLIRAVAHPPGEFEAWLRDNGRPITAPPTPAESPTPQSTPTSRAPGTPQSAGDPVRGAQLFRQKTCISCHAINGMPNATARAGPDLTHFASRATIGAGVLDNTSENIARWLRDPQAVKPGNYMPNMLLAEQEVLDLTSFMETLK